MAWGDNRYGELGDDTTTQRDTPTLISLPGGVNATMVAAGGRFSLAVGSDGKIYAWGDNSYGQLGDGTITQRDKPTLIALPGGVAATAVSAGTVFSLALGADGNVYAWGDNSYGQLGNGTVGSRAGLGGVPEPIALPGGVTATAVSAGSQFSLAIGSDGNVYSWGDNAYRELGDGTGTSRDTPELIILPGGVTAITVSAGSRFSLAVGSDGKVYAWGDNSYGQLGDGTIVAQATPEPVALPGGVAATAVSAGTGFSLALGSDGKVYAWGDNSYGQLGDGTINTQRNTPELIILPGGVTATTVSAGSVFSLAIGSDGNVYAWGDNGAGELGDGTTTGHTTPQPIASPGLRATRVSAGSLFGLATGSSPPIAPRFTTASPPMTVTVGSSLAYMFVAAGLPSPVYAMSPGSPAWLSIDPTSGTLTGIVPAGPTNFSYSVTAANSVGAATAGPFAVTVRNLAVVNGFVVDGDNNPVLDAIVDAYAVGGGVITSATTISTGAFSVSVLPGTYLTLDAFSSRIGDLQSGSSGPIEVTINGIQDVVIVLPSILPLPTSLLLNGSNTVQVLGWSQPAQVNVTGSPNGLATVAIIGRDTTTARLAYNVVILAESPPGSGSYSGVLPPPNPIHGPVAIQTAVSCPPQSVLVPSLGTSAGGDTVIVTGSGFTGATALSFDGTPALSFTVLSDMGIQAVASAGTGTVPVTVYGGSAPGSGVVVDQYTYVAIESVTPASGPAAGGTWVIITGTGLLSATSVRFGQDSAEFITLSSTQIEALSPPGELGTQDITVDTLYGGTTPATAADQFTYTMGSGASAPGALGHANPLAAPEPLMRDAEVPGANPNLGPVTATGSLLPSSNPAIPSPGNIAAEVLKYVYQEGPSLLSSWSLLKKQVDFALAGLNPSCENNKQLVADLIKASMDPFVKAAVAENLPLVEAGVIALFSETGPAALAIALAITPVALNWLVKEFVSRVTKVAVTAALGDCPKQDTPQPPQPPPPPAPGGGSNGGGVGGSGPLGGYAPNALIDPSGTVLDSNGNPVSGATVTILRADTADGPFAPVDVTAPGIQPAVNPQTTAGDGVFHWDVRAGFYEVQATAPDCTAAGNPAQPAATTGPYPVPPPQVGLAITMACLNEAPPPVPVVQSLSESTGPPTGGTPVTILGGGFTPSSSVTFGGAPAQKITYLSPQALTVLAPTGNGLVDVVVQTAGGSSTISAADQFFYGYPPAITGLAPQFGPTTGGTQVTIRGTGFTGAIQVGFSGLPASLLVVDSDTQIRATTPPAAAGPVNTFVITPAGVSGNSPEQFTYQNIAPHFSADSPPLTAEIGETYTYTFAATGLPAPTYSLEAGSPPWLSINPATGLLTGTVVATGPVVGMALFFAVTYAVTATNIAGSATAGPFTLIVFRRNFGPPGTPP